MNGSRKIISIPDASILFRNFRGEARQYNQAGNRNFNLNLTPEMAEMLREEGFNIRVRQRDAESEPTYLLPVKVSYRFQAPKVVLITSRSKRLLDEDTIGELDYAQIEHIDLTISPSHWTMPSGKSGVTAYLNSMYVTLAEDEFENKYLSEDDDGLPF